MSACDFDNGDCANVTEKDLSFNSRSTFESCALGCVTTWIGDRYCDQKCKYALLYYVDKYFKKYVTKLTRITGLRSAGLMLGTAEGSF